MRLSRVGSSDLRIVPLAPATVRKTPRVRPNHVHVASEPEMPAKAKAKFW